MLGFSCHKTFPRGNLVQAFFNDVPMLCSVYVYYVAWGMIEMIIKDIWIGTSNWLHSRKGIHTVAMDSEIDSEGLLCLEQEGPYTHQKEIEPLTGSTDLLVKTMESKDQKNHIEQFQEGLNKLTDQLQGINDRLGQQVAQHQRLIESIDNFPGHFRDLPEMLEQHKKASTAMLEQVETQTEVLDRIERRLTLAGDSESRLANNIGTMTETLHFISAHGSNQAESLEEIYRTLFKGEQYIKHVLSAQIRRLTWIWGISILLCLAVLGVVIYSYLSMSI